MKEVTVFLGADRFSADAKQAGDDFLNLAPVMIRVAKTILQTAKALVPRDTGALAMSMYPTATPTIAQVSTNLVYAPVIHWGWRGHNIEPNPWLVEAAHRSEAAWVHFFEEHIDATLKTMDKDYRKL